MDGVEDNRELYAGIMCLYAVIVSIIDAFLCLSEGYAHHFKRQQQRGTT